MSIPIEADSFGEICKMVELEMRIPLQNVFDQSDEFWECEDSDCKQWFVYVGSMIDIVDFQLTVGYMFPAHYLPRTPVCQWEPTDCASWIVGLPSKHDLTQFKLSHG